MTMIDFVALAEQGVDAWNRWRAEHPDHYPDLSRAYLYGYTLSGFDLSHTDLSRACLIDADLQGANLSEACLESIYASSANFTGANLTGADLRQGSFSEANFTEADLSAVKAESSNFGGACLMGACLMGWQADNNTVFIEVKADHIYLGARKSLRWPLTGEAQVSEVAKFLQQRHSTRSQLVPAIAATINRTVNKSTLILGRLRSELFAVGFDLKVLLALQTARLRYLFQRGWSQGLPAAGKRVYTLWVRSRLGTQAMARYLARVSRGAYRHWQTISIPYTQRQIQQYWQLTRRHSRCWQIQSRRLSTKAHKRSGLWWQQFVLGEGRFQKKATRSHQTLRIVFTHLSRRLRVFTIRCSQSTATGSIRNAKKLHQQWQQTCLLIQQSLAPKFLHLQLGWREFLQGNSIWQQWLTQAQQQRRSHFNLVSQSMTVERKRQLKALQIASGLSRRRLRIVQWRASRYAKAKGGWWSLPGYFTASVATVVGSTLTLVSHRYPIPAAIGSVAIIFLGFSLSRRQPPLLPQATVTTSVAHSTQQQSYLEPAVANTALSAVKEVSSQILPCPSGVLKDMGDATGYTYEDGSVFYGEMNDSQPADGAGTMIYATGNRYDGNYQNGQRSGCGIFTYSNGQRYIGQFAADKFSGQGTWILENGERYIGEFKDNECNGKGTFIFTNGSVNSGIWQAGKLEDSDLLCKLGSLRVPSSSDN